MVKISELVQDSCLNSNQHFLSKNVEIYFFSVGEFSKLISHSWPNYVGNVVLFLTKVFLSTHTSDWIAYCFG